jgi:hypothetical protein
LFDIKFLKNFPFGMFVGSVIVLMLCWAFDADIREGLSKFYTFVFSALIGLFAASVALSGVLASLDHQSKLREEDRKRKLFAARAVLPQALSDMCEVARRGMLNSEIAGVKNSKELESTFALKSLADIRLSDEIVSVFKGVIEFSDDNFGKRIQGILSEHQILQARWKSHVRDRDNIMSRSTSDLAHSICHWAFLYPLTSTAFPYARMEPNAVKGFVNESEITTALHNLGPSANQDDPELLKAVEFYARYFQQQHVF